MPERLLSATQVMVCISPGWVTDSAESKLPELMSCPPKRPGQYSTAIVVYCSECCVSDIPTITATGACWKIFASDSTQSSGATS